MEATIDATVIEECTRLAFEDKMTFPETIKRLAVIGVERYHADLNRLEKTYYKRSGGTIQEELPLTNAPAIGVDFFESRVVEALRAIQQKTIDYAEFLRRIMAAGAASYDVFLDGRNAVYMGRKGEIYVEKFPGGK